MADGTRVALLLGRAHCRIGAILMSGQGGKRHYKGYKVNTSLRKLYHLKYRHFVRMSFPTPVMKRMGAIQFLLCSVREWLAR